MPYWNPIHPTKQQRIDAFNLLTKRHYLFDFCLYSDSDKRFLGPADKRFMKDEPNEKKRLAVLKSYLRTGQQYPCIYPHKAYTKTQDKEGWLLFSSFICLDFDNHKGEINNKEAIDEAILVAAAHGLTNYILYKSSDSQKSNSYHLIFPFDYVECGALKRWAESTFRYLQSKYSISLDIFPRNERAWDWNYGSFVRTRFNKHSPKTLDFFHEVYHFTDSYNDLPKTLWAFENRPISFEERNSPFLVHVTLPDGIEKEEKRKEYINDWGLSISTKDGIHKLLRNPKLSSYKRRGFAPIIARMSQTAESFAVSMVYVKRLLVKAGRFNHDKNQGYIPDYLKYWKDFQEIRNTKYLSSTESGLAYEIARLILAEHNKLYRVYIKGLTKVIYNSIIAGKFNSSETYVTIRSSGIANSKQYREILELAQKFWTKFMSVHYIKGIKGFNPTIFQGSFSCMYKSITENMSQELRSIKDRVCSLIDIASLSLVEIFDKLGAIAYAKGQLPRTDSLLDST